jgi:hypothetical protein
MKMGKPTEEEEEEEEGGGGGGGEEEDTQKAFVYCIYNKLFHIISTC